MSAIDHSYDDVVMDAISCLNYEKGKSNCSCTKKNSDCKLPWTTHMLKAVRSFLFSNLMFALAFTEHVLLH